MQVHHSLSRVCCCDNAHTPSPRRHLASAGGPSHWHAFGRPCRESQPAKSSQGLLQGKSGLLMGGPTVSSVSSLNVSALTVAGQRRLAADLLRVFPSLKDMVIEHRVIIYGPLLCPGCHSTICCMIVAWKSLKGLHLSQCHCQWRPDRSVVSSNLRPAAIGLCHKSGADAPPIVLLCN